jgi:hypothetical protein
MGANPEATFDGLLTNASFWAPEHLSESAWLEHAPFAFWLIQACQPRSFVELGTHSGFSYFAVCQTVGRLGLGTRCYAVDTWQGDEHAGFYGEDVFQAVSQTNEQHFAGFSQLIRGTFDSARPEFLDGSIDVLHIDGRHFYEDVRHDVDTWLSALSPRGVLLLHDIEVRERSFGVHRLWAELREQYRTFSFVHGHGLGVVAVGSEVPPKVADLVGLEADGRNSILLRTGYARLGEAVRETLTTRRLRSELAAREAETKVRAAEEEERIRVAMADLTNMAAALTDREDQIARLMVTSDELRAIKGSTLMRVRAAVKEEPFGFSKLAHIARLSLALVLAQFRRRPRAAKAGTSTGEVEERPSRSAELESAAHGFDPDFYLAEYPDIAAAGIDPLDHYLRLGKSEGRLPRSPGPTSGKLSEFALPAHAENYRPLVSIIVPAYNHGEFLEERLESIYRQTYKGPVEVYLLDDSSSDHSPRILRSFAERFSTVTTLITNPENSGSAFRQWRRGLALARGDTVWIAESDDLCDLDFLETLVPFMANPAVMLAYSRTVFFRDTTRNVVLTLEDYLHDVGPFRFDIPWIQPAAALVATGFAEKNLVPNVSGAIFRHPGRMTFLDSDEWLDMRLAGDWIFYLEIIKSGLVAYSPATTNYHRSNDTTLTSRINASSSVLAQEIAQAKATAHRLYRIGTPADRTPHLPSPPVASIPGP